MRTILGTVLALALVTAPAALAGHGGDPVSIHATYELGPTFFVWSCPPGDAGLGCDPTGQTQDGSIDLGGVQIFAEDVPRGVDSVQAAVVDDVFGPGSVAGFLCTEEDGNNVCGETDKGEAAQVFCGSSSTLSIPPAPNWEKTDVFVSYYGWELTDCDLADGFATSGGVLNPNAGIFVTFG